MRLLIVKRIHLAIWAMLAALAIGAPSATAHPHVWIDMTVSSVFGDEGKLTGFTHVWAFDEFYTVFQLEGFELSSGDKPSQEQLDKYAVEMTDSIAQFGYLMRIEGRDGRLDVDAGNQSARVRPDQRLELTFTVDLKQPVDATDWPVRYSVYDPDYYIEMLHEKGTGVLMTGNPPATCTMDVDRPSPTFEMISLAASLDRMDQGPDTLGAAFAENVTIDCRPEEARSAE
ncbi:DUF1007 family protein [Pyruvatibacter sp. HU-CL02332]